MNYFNCLEIHLSFNTFLLTTVSYDPVEDLHKVDVAWVGLSCT